MWHSCIGRRFASADYIQSKLVLAALLILLSLILGCGGSNSTTGTNSNTTTTPLTIATSSLPNGVVNTAYSSTLSATGGVTPYTWEVASGALPTGVSLASSTGIISGLPSAAGTFDVTLGVEGANASLATSKFAITIVAAAPAITTAALPNGVEGSPYDASVSATGGTPPYTWSLASGSLPSSVALAATTGDISGIPSSAGTFTPSLQVTDSALQTANKSLSFRIATFDSLKKCTVLTPWPAETLAGDCSPYASPNDAEPAVYNGNAATVYTDPVFGTKVKRLTPQPGMTVQSYFPKYAPYQSWSKNGTYLILAGNNGGAYLFYGTDPYTFIRQVSFPTFDGWDEPEWFWSNTDDCLLLYVNSNKIQTVNVCNGDAVTTLATFTSLTDTQGHKLNLSSTVLLKSYIYCHQSNDDTKIGMLAVSTSTGTQGFGVFSMNIGAGTASNTWFHIVTSGGDLSETGVPKNRIPGGVCVSPQGSYVQVTWNTYYTGNSQSLSSLVRSNNVVTATSGGSGWPSGIVNGATISIDSVDSDTSFNGTFGPVTVSGNAVTYGQNGANSLLAALNTGSCTVNGSSSSNCGGELDYHYYGIQQFDAATGAPGPQIDRATTHNDQMVLADGTDAFLEQWNLVHNDFRRYGAYKYGTSVYDASQVGTGNPEANFQFAQMPDAAGGTFTFHISGEGSNSSNGLPGWALVSTYASTQVVDCAPQIVYCAEVMAVKMDGSNTFYRIAHSQSIQVNSNGTEMYYAEPHATPSRDFTHIVWGSNWRDSVNNIDAFLVELP